MKRIFILLFLLPLLSKAQVYQAMPQAGYGPVKRMLFDSVLTLPLGIAKLQNITGGRDTGQIRYNKADSSIYTYSGNGWRKVSGGGSTIDTTSLSNRINLKLNAVDTASLSNRIDSKLTSISATSPITVTSGITPIISTSMSTNKLIGRSTAGTGVMEQIAIGSGLTLNGGTLTNTATPTPLGYYGAFQDNTIQTAAAINTPYAMKFGVTDLNNQVTIVSDGSNLTKITIANTGVYNIQFSAQFDRTNSGTDVVDIWLRKNGVDVIGSGGKIVLTGGAAQSALIAAWNYVLDVTAGDYYQLMWSSPDTHVRILSEVAQTSPFSHPIIPSTILTVTQQSGIMAGTGVTAINSLTGSAQTMVTGTDSLDFKIVSSGTQHKFNLPDASASARGVITTGTQTIAGAKTFSNTVNVSPNTTINGGDDGNAILRGTTNLGKGLDITAYDNNATLGTLTATAGAGGLFINSGDLTALTANSVSGNHANFGSTSGLTVLNSGRTLIGATDNLSDKLQVNGIVSATALKLAAGTASVAPIKFTAGTNLTSAAAGAMEYDATNNLLAFTSNTTLGRGVVPNFNSYWLRGTSSAITTIDNFFGANSNIPVTAGYYEIEIEMFFLKTTASTIVWTLTASGGWAVAYDYIQSPAVGVPLTVPNANYLKLSQPYASGASFGVTTASLSTGVNHYAKFKLFAAFPSTTSLTIKVTPTSGSVTPLQLSNWKATKLPSTNIGTYAP